MTANTPDDAPTSDEATGPDNLTGDQSTSDATSDQPSAELEPTEGRTVGQGVEPVSPDSASPDDHTPDPTAGLPVDHHRKQSPEVHRQTRVGAAFVALGVGFVILVLLLIFILQNLSKATVKFFGAQGQMPLGVLLLFSAAGGALIVVIFGAARIIQLHWLARRDRRSTRKTP